MLEIDPFMPAEYYAYKDQYRSGLDVLADQALAEVEAEQALTVTPLTDAIQ